MQKIRVLLKNLPLIICFGTFLTSCASVPPPEAAGERNRRQITLFHQLKKLQEYEIGKLTETEFLHDKWRPIDAWHGKIGIIGIQMLTPDIPYEIKLRSEHFANGSTTKFYHLGKVIEQIAGILRADKQTAGYALGIMANDPTMSEGFEAISVANIILEDASKGKNVFLAFSPEGSSTGFSFNIDDDRTACILLFSKNILTNKYCIKKLKGVFLQ